MIRLSSPNQGLLLLNPREILSVEDAGASSAYMGIRAYVRMTDGRSFDVRETLDDIDLAVRNSEGKEL